MNYKDYKISRNLAWEVLIDQRVRELPVKISDICRNMGIDVRMYYPKDGNGGQAQILNSRATILINANDPICRQRFSAAHELGHILLGHVGKYGLVNREISPEDNPIEQAANVFASRILAPACVLKELGVSSAEEIAELCNISITAAEFRYKRLSELIIRDKFYISPLEVKVHKQFSKYIRKNKL